MHATMQEKTGLVDFRKINFLVKEKSPMLQCMKVR